MSQDVIWGQFVSFPPYLFPPSPPPPQAGSETTDSITSTPSFPTWLHYPTELSKILMSSAESLGWGGCDTGDSIFLCDSQGVGREARGPWLVQDSDSIYFTASYFCWEGQLVLGSETPWDWDLVCLVQRFTGFLNETAIGPWHTYLWRPHPNHMKHIKMLSDSTLNVILW